MEYAKRRGWERDRRRRKRETDRDGLREFFFFFLTSGVFESLTWASTRWRQMKLTMEANGKWERGKTQTWFVEQVLTSPRHVISPPLLLAACPVCIGRPPLHLFYSLTPIHLLVLHPSILALTLSDTNIHSLPPSPSPFANVVNGGISRLIRHVYEWSEVSGEVGAPCQKWRTSLLHAPVPGWSNLPQRRWL